MVTIEVSNCDSAFYTRGPQQFLMIAYSRDLVARRIYARYKVSPCELFPLSGAGRSKDRWRFIPAFWAFAKNILKQKIRTGSSIWCKGMPRFKYRSMRGMAYLVTRSIFESLMWMVYSRSIWNAVWIRQGTRIHRSIAHQ